MNNMLIIASKPKLTMIVPEIRLIQIMVSRLTIIRKEPVRTLNENHQMLDPRKIPKTMLLAARLSLGWLFTIPKPAKIAAKEMMVIGLVSVRNRVDA